MAISKRIREEVYRKYDGHCAYYSVISRAEYIAPVTNRDRYEEAVEAWNRRVDNG